MIDVVGWILIVSSVPVIVFLVITTHRHARALSDRIDEHHKEQEEKKQAGGPINPYEDIARLMNAAPEHEDRKDDQ